MKAAVSRAAIGVRIFPPFKTGRVLVVDGEND